MLSQLLSSLRLFLRVPVLVAYFALGACAVAFLAVVCRLTGGAHHLFRCWCRGFLWLLNVHVRVVGEPITDHAALFVANHISWLDVLIIAGVAPVRFVAKQEIAGWPIVGWIAKQLGTLFIARGSAGAGRAAADLMANQLEGGVSVLVFPEGKTTRGHNDTRFHARTFESAVRASVPVQAVAIRYASDHGLPCPKAPFVDDHTFISHLQQILLVRATDVALVFCEPIHIVDQSRSWLAKTTQQQVHDALELPLLPVRPLRGAVQGTS